MVVQVWAEADAATPRSAAVIEMNSLFITPKILRRI
jgi:hypothetical protein